MLSHPYRIALAQGITLTTIEGKDVLFSLRSGDSFGLNETAAAMLRLLIEAGSAAAVARLAADYAAPAEEIAADLDELVEGLAGLKLVELKRA